MNAPSAPPAMRRSVTTLVTACALIAGPVHAAPAPAPAPAPATTSDPAVLTAFEEGFKEGQALFDAGKPLEAARRWVAAASLLPEKTANRDQRAGIYEYIVDAYMGGLQDGGNLGDLREAFAAIDTYCEGYTRAYGTETPLGAKVAGARLELKSRLDAAEKSAAATPVELPRPAEPVEAPPPPPPTGKPWRPLVISGAVVTGVAGLAFGVALLGGVSGLRLTREYDASCVKDDPSPMCTDLYARGTASNGQVISGAVLGGVLLAVGVPLLVIGLKRRQTARHAVRPLLGPGFVGVGVGGRF